jgi:hypothetical protein
MIAIVTIYEVKYKMQSVEKESCNSFLNMFIWYVRGIKLFFITVMITETLIDGVYIIHIIICTSNALDVSNLIYP